MNHDAETGDDALAPIDLHAWRVPPPPPLDRPLIVGRALSPAASARRPRLAWMLAALALANAVLAAIVVIVLSQPSPRPAAAVQVAGGGSVDAPTRRLLRRLEQEQRALERKLAEVQQLRADVEDLAERVRQCEGDERRDRDRPGPNRRREAPAPSVLGTCDEVSCVLTNYAGACCATYQRGVGAAGTSTSASTNRLPDALDRDMIVAGIARVRAQALACARHSTAKGNVTLRIRVRPSGRVGDVLVDSAPDPDLARCIVSIIGNATFEPTHHGGSFSYPFVFGGSP